MTFPSAWGLSINEASMAPTKSASTISISLRGQGFVNKPSKAHTDFTETAASVTPPPIYLTVVPILQKNLKTRSPKGLQGINNFQSNRVYEAVTAAQNLIGKDRLTFATITTPDLPGIKLRKLWSNHSTVIKEIKQAIVRLLKKHHPLTPEVLIVTELQTERFEATKLPYLHLHLLFQGRGLAKRWLVTHSDIQRIATRAFKKHVDCIPGFKAGVELQSIHTSVAGYLAKKESKDRKVASSLIQAGFKDCVPHHWVSMTRALRTLANTRIPLDDWAMRIIQDGIAGKMPGMLSYCQKVHRDKDNPERGAWGHSFRLDDDWLRFLLTGESRYLTGV